jgi:glycosyltransferase involved in cell wall biosynthesis
VTGPRIVYVVGTYPLPTTTFIDREIRQLRSMGVRVEPISLRRPARGLSEGQRELQTSVTYVLPASAWQVVRSHASFIVRRPGAYVKAFISLAGRPHPNLASRVRTIGHVGLAVHVARIVRDMGPVDRLHAHFVDRAAVVALVAGRLLDLPWSATAHANDIYVRPVLLPEKLTGATFVATCTRYNERHLRSVAPDAAIRCIYHGLDLRGYEPRTAEGRARPLLLSVAQLKEKKGLGYLLDACRALTDRGVDVDVEIVGEGPLRARLEAQADALGLTDRVRFLGALPHDEVVARYAEATAFVLPCVTASDGDRDGIPNVILEAMAMGLPVVSTRHSGIPEAVEDGETGLLVEPGDTDALADALATLLADPERGDWMGAAGRRRVEKVFDVEINVRRLAEEFGA